MAKTLYKTLSGIQSAFFLALILITPLFFGGTGKTGSFLIESLVLAASLIFVCRAFIFKIQPFGQDMKWTYACAVWLLPFLAYVLLQIYAGHAVFNHLPGSVAPFRSVDYLAQLFCYVLFFFLCLDYFSSRKKVNRLVVLVALELVFMIALGYYQEYSEFRKFGKMYGIFDMTQYNIYFSSFLNPNHYGAFVAIASLFLAARILYYVFTMEYFKVNQAFVRALLCGVVLVLGMFSVVHAHARAALFGEILSLTALIAAVVPPKRRLMIFGAVATVAAGMAAYVAFSRIDLTEFTAAILMKDFGGRLTIYRESLGIVKDFTAFGSGLGTTVYLSPLYQKTLAENYNWLHLYNHHLELLEETGITGYVLFMAPLAALCVHSFKKILGSASNWCRIYGMMGVSAAGFIFFFSFVDDYLITPAVALYFIAHLSIMAKCATTSFIKVQSRAGQYDNLSFRRGSLALPFAAVFLGLFYFLSVDYQAARAYNFADGRIELLEKAIRLRPEDPDNWLALGDLLYDKSMDRQGDDFERTIERSIHAYEKARDLVPISFKTWTALGRAKILKGDRIKGFKDIEHGLTLSPYNRDAYLYAIAFYLRIADETPWADEARLFRENAVRLIGRTYEIKKPLKANNMGYLKNFPPYPIDPQDRKRVLQALNIYLSRNEGGNA